MPFRTSSDYYVLGLFLLVNFLRSLLLPLLLAVNSCSRDTGHENLLLSPVCIYHVLIVPDSLVNEELLPHIDLHVVGVVALKALVKLLGLGHHFKLLLCYHFLVGSEILHSVLLQEIVLYLTSDSVGFDLEL